LKITFLGTGTSQGVPVIACSCNICHSKKSKDKRLRSSIIIETNELNLIVDAGPDFRYQALRANIKKLDGILITHGHRDHVGGLDDVRAFNYQQQKPMPVYAGSFAISDIKREFQYAFEQNKYPGSPKIDLIELVNKSFNIQELEITPIQMVHYKNPVFGYRIGGFTYITDTSFIPEKEKEKIKGSEIIVLNAVRKEKHYSHFNLEEAVDLLKELKPKKGYLTHISHLMGLHDEINNELPDFIELAYDGLSIEINY
jgi:phosphoribosyl 1,2-cyclic phosphate phosphodiesterase